MPGLTNSRLSEAAQQGFFFGGGGLDKFSRAMIKEHEGLRLKKYKDNLGFTSIGCKHWNICGGSVPRIPRWEPMAARPPADSSPIWPVSVMIDKPRICLPQEAILLSSN